ncbi:MAG: MFS transporter [Alphaproteobacteria bacterium]|nr:MFS transporter [Alphaproteobacteria bacterium]
MRRMDHESQNSAPIVPEETYVAGEAAAGSIFARLLARPEGLSTTGLPVASLLGQVSWAMYEWARNPYVLLITIYIFAPYFTTVVVGDAVRGQAIWGDIASSGGFIIAVLAPFLGAVADAGGRRKPWLLLYTVIMVVGMLLLWHALPHAGPGLIIAIGAVVALTNISYEFSAVFHNSMLPAIAPKSRVGSLSGLGLALGNVAGILLLGFMLIALSLPGRVHWAIIPAHPLFGFSQALHEPERLAGPMAAVWLAVFSVPLFLFTPDQPSLRLGLFGAVRAGVRSVLQTLRSLSHYRNVAHYLGARAVFNDGMTGVLTFSGIYAAGTFHWGAVRMAFYGLELSVFAVMGGFLGGWLDDRLGSKPTLIISLTGTVVSSLLSLTMGPDRIFWFIHYNLHDAPLWHFPIFNTPPELIFLAVLNIGAMCITAAYASSRTMLARIAPAERMGEFFGIFSLSGTSTTFLAPLGVSVLTTATHSQRGGMFAIAFFLVIGLVWMIFCVKEIRAQAL